MGHYSSCAWERTARVNLQISTRALTRNSGERTRLACGFRRLAEISSLGSGNNPLRERKFAIARARSPAREARALPERESNSTRAKRCDGASTNAGQPAGFKRSHSVWYASMSAEILEWKASCAE